MNRKQTGYLLLCGRSTEVTHMRANVDHQMLLHVRAGKAKPAGSWRLSFMGKKAKCYDGPRIPAHNPPCLIFRSCKGWHTALPRAGPAALPLGPHTPHHHYKETKPVLEKFWICSHSTVWWSTNDNHILTNVACNWQQAAMKKHWSGCQQPQFQSQLHDPGQSVYPPKVSFFILKQRGG